jgi:hypothetical protein
VTGAVTPQVAGGKVSVTLLRKVGSTWTKVAAKTVGLSSAGRYSTTFTRTAAGSCQVSVKFLGAAEYLASSVTKSFSC